MIYDKQELLTKIAELETTIQRFEDGEYTYSEEQEYKEMLDECYPEYKFGDYIYYPSNILQSCDPTCFKIGMDEYFDSRLEDLQSELEELQENLTWLDENDSDSD